jgi:hypothetical protein
VNVPEIQAVYNEIGESGPEAWPPPLPEDMPDERADIEGSGLFEDVKVRRYPWEVVYTLDPSRRACQAPGR